MHHLCNPKGSCVRNKAGWTTAFRYIFTCQPFLILGVRTVILASLKIILIFPDKCLPSRCALKNNSAKTGCLNSFCFVGRGALSLCLFAFTSSFCHWWRVLRATRTAPSCQRCHRWSIGGGEMSNYVRSALQATGRRGTLAGMRRVKKNTVFEKLYCL